jgi:hypothetical protein
MCKEYKATMSVVPEDQIGRSSRETTWLSSALGGGDDCAQHAAMMLANVSCTT